MNEEASRHQRRRPPAERAGVSKATVYRRWTAKADVVADAVATLDAMDPPRYPGTSLRDDLLALAADAGHVPMSDDALDLLRWGYSRRAPGP